MWLHLLFNTIIPFSILVITNLSIYRKLVSVSSNKCTTNFKIPASVYSRYRTEESGGRKKIDFGEEN